MKRAMLLGMLLVCGLWVGGCEPKPAPSKVKVPEGALLLYLGTLGSAKIDCPQVSGTIYVVDASTDEVHYALYVPAGKTWNVNGLSTEIRWAVYLAKDNGTEIAATNPSAQTQPAVK